MNNNYVSAQPQIRQLITHFYSNLRLIDTQIMGEQRHAFTLRQFRDLARRMLDDVRSVLLKKWIKGIQSTLVSVTRLDIIK